jgi:glutaminyl-tRNA synthetase
MEVAEKKFQRLAPGKEVRLKNAYIIKCDEEHPCDKDANGNVTTIYATYDPETRSGQPGADRKIKGKTLHWVNCQDAVKAEVRLYDRLFSVENPGADERDFRDLLNPDSLKVLNNSVVEPYLKEKKPGDFLQFQRIGYFTLDLDSTPEHLVFNKTVGLKDTWKR